MCFFYCSRYRSIDGLCNNLVNHRLGAADTAYGEFLGKRYQDGNSICNTFTKMNSVQSIEIFDCRYS